MLTEIEGAEEFYPFTASLFPRDNGAKVLDLGCGTGLELEARESLKLPAYSNSELLVGIIALG